MQMICIWSICCHCHPIISCFIKIQIGLTFLVPAYPGCPGKESVRRLLFLSIGLLIAHYSCSQLPVLADMKVTEQYSEDSCICPLLSGCW